MVINAEKMAPNADGVVQSPGKVIKHTPKAYIYLPMGFALLVEMLQLRYEHNKKRNISSNN